MKRMLVCGGRVAAAITAGTMLAGCAFAVVPPKKHAAASASPTASLRDPYGYREADAPALLTQCAVDTAGLRPGPGLNWFSHGRVTVNTTNADNFSSCGGARQAGALLPDVRHRRAPDALPGVRHHLDENGSLWVPAHLGDKNPLALDYACRLDRLDRGQRQAAPRGLRHDADGEPTPGADLRERNP